MRIMIVGGGKKVDFLVQSLVSKKNEITVINDNEKECITLAHSHDHVQVVFGDGSKPFILEDAGIKKIDLMIALTEKDADNFVICELSKKVFGVKRAFAIVTNPKNVDVFKKLGINTVVSATHILAKVIEQMASVQEVVNYLPLEDDKLELIEINLKNNHEICGMKLADIAFPQNAIIGCVMRNGDVLIPNGSTIIKGGDKLTILSSADAKQSVIDALIGSSKL